MSGFEIPRMTLTSCIVSCIVGGGGGDGMIESTSPSSNGTEAVRRMNPLWTVNGLAVPPAEDSSFGTACNGDPQP